MIKEEFKDWEHSLICGLVDVLMVMDDEDGEGDVCIVDVDVGNGGAKAAPKGGSDLEAIIGFSRWIVRPNTGDPLDDDRG